MDTFGWASAGQHDDVYLPRSVGQVSCDRFELEDAFLGACFGQLHSDSIGGGGAAMDTFGCAGAGQHDDVYLPRSVGQVSCGRFELEDAFLGACFGQLHSDSLDGGDVGACHVSSNFGAVGGAAALASDPLGSFNSGVDVFSSVVDDAGAHDGLLNTAFAFSRELVEGDGGTVSNGAMVSSYRGTTGGNFYSGESDNYKGGRGHDAEVVSLTSTISPTTPSLPLTTSTQALNPKRKLGPTIATAPPAPPLPRPGAKRKATTTATSITFGQGAHDPTAGAAGGYEPDMEAKEQVKELVYLAAAMRPVNLGTDAVADKPRRKNVRISSNPQTVAARLRRERVNERLRVLQNLVPGGSKMDTASMLDEAASYLKFLKSLVHAGAGNPRWQQQHQHHHHHQHGQVTAALLQQPP